MQCSQILCRRNRVPMLDFAKTAEASFLSGPPKIQKYGRTFGVLINVVVCLIHLQSTTISILYASTLFQQVSNDFIYDFHLRSPNSRKIIFPYHRRIDVDFNDFFFFFLSFIAFDHQIRTTFG